MMSYEQGIRDTLPPLMVEAIDVLSELHNAPFELSLQTVLGVANFAAQKHYDVDTHVFGVKPISEFFIALAHSGGAKTTIFMELMGGVKQFIEEDRIRFTEEMRIYNIKLAKFKKEEKRIFKYTDMDQMELDLYDLYENAPIKPVGVKHLVDNPTLNGIAKALEEVPDIGLLSSEGGTFINSWGFQDATRGMEFATNLTKLWDGNGMSKQTGDMQLDLQHRRFNMLLMLQQEIAAPLLCNAQFAGQGLLARMLITAVPLHEMPEIDLTEAGEHKKENARKRLDKFNKRIYNLYSQTPNVSKQDHLELVPTVLDWNQDALDLVAVWFNEHKTKINTEYADIGAFTMRCLEHLMRLAATICIFETNDKITLGNVICAITLIEMYIYNLQNLNVPTHSTSYRSWKKPIVESMERFFDNDKLFKKHGWDVDGVPKSKIQKYGSVAFRALDVAPQLEILTEMEQLGIIAAHSVVAVNGRNTVLYKKT